jgi:hypothetical protein
MGLDSAQSIGHACHMALTEESLDQALSQLALSGTGIDEAGGSDPSSLEMAELLKVVETANGGEELPSTAFGMAGGYGKVIEKLGELITKLRSALAALVRKIAGAVSFSIGVTGPVLSVSVNFNP